jgi:hypothetical protein
MELIINWLFNSCRWGHKWRKKDGNLMKIRSAERGFPGEVLVKNPDGGWLRYERYCKRCLHTQYLRQLDDTGREAKWEDVPK